MAEIEIIDSSIHHNPEGERFVAALIDDANDGRVKLVIMFEEEGYTAVLDLDTLIDEEDISAKKHTHLGGRYDTLLRDLLWE
jgi:formate-dependent nitrite reductase cytochrome c552 subunit